MNCLQALLFAFFALSGTLIDSFRCLNTDIKIGNQEQESTSISFSSNLDNLKSAVESKLDSPFQLVVTLGDNCLPKFRLQSYHQQNKNFEIISHLFDWMNIFNYTAFSMAVDNDFKDVFGLDYLNVQSTIWGHGRKVLYSKKYQMEFNHAFEGFREVSHTDYRNLLTQWSFRRFYHLIDQKYKYLTENSQKAINNSKKTLYVINAGYSPQVPDAEKQSDFLNLLHSIKSKRDDNFVLLVLIRDNSGINQKYDFDVLIEGNLIFHRIKDFDLHRWHTYESILQWNQIFDLFLQK